MIATILPGSSNFHAVGYNEHKVSKGVARLIEIQNFGSLGTFHKPTPSELVGYLQKYSSQNSRIRKPQFHVAISCKGHDMSEEELLDFAHQYLKEMGYGESGQPLLVYSHYDTENTHLHIITSRVAPDWKSHSTLPLLATQDLPTFLYYMIDPLKSWCWGAILFYPFKNSRFS